MDGRWFSGCFGHQLHNGKPFVVTDHMCALGTPSTPPLALQLSYFFSHLALIHRLALHHRLPLHRWLALIHRLALHHRLLHRDLALLHRWHLSRGHRDCRADHTNTSSLWHRSLDHVAATRHLHTRGAVHDAGLLGQHAASAAAHGQEILPKWCG